MCCRVLLLVIVLTCTFQSEIKAESDDVLCVLLLSGLHKQDLDGTLLKKLQKHNVNIDDLNKKDTIEKCLTKAISKMPKSDISTLTEQLLPKNSDKHEEISPATNKESYNVIETTKATQTINKNDGNINITNILYTNKRQITNNNSVLFSIENVMNLWRMINTAKFIHHNQTVEVSRKHVIVDTPTNDKKNDNIDAQQKEYDFFKKILENFNAATETSTQKPTTHSQMDLISQQIQKFLENNNNDYQNLINRLSELNNSSTQKPYKDIKESRKTYSMKYINTLLNQQDEKMKNFSGSRLTYPYYIEAHTNAPQEEFTNYPKPLSDNIIKEITEQIKNTLLKDLKEQLASTTLETTTRERTTVTTTYKTPRDIQHKQNDTTDIYEKIKVLFQELKKETTERPTKTTTEIFSTTTVLQKAHDSIKDATNALENFIAMFNEFKKVKIEPTLNYKLTTIKSNGNHLQDSPNVLYPTFLPLNYPVNVQTKPVTALPVLVNHYQNFLHMNNPIVEKTNTFQRVHQERYTIRRPYNTVKLSDFYQNPVNNLKSNIEDFHALQVAPIIQTDAIEVPPLSIPVSKALNLINTNIIVTTQHPMVQYRESHQHHYTKDPRYLDYLIRSESRSNDGRNDARPDADPVKISDTDWPIKYHNNLERNYEPGNAYAQHGILPQSQRLPRIIHNPDVIYRDYIGKLKDHGDLVHSWDRNRENYHHDRNLDRALEWQRDMRGHDWDIEGPELWQRETRERENKLHRPDSWRYRNDKRSERPRHGIIREKLLEPNNRQKVASRQQLSILDLKKKAKYDDTHYKNFLKTQQKVNDMLEKILATRVPDRIHSVETPDTVHAYVN